MVLPCVPDADAVAVLVKFVARDYRAFRLLEPELRATREIAFAAVASFGGNLQHVAPPLSHDRDLVLAAVRSHGHALKFAPPHLADDEEVVMAAVSAPEEGGLRGVNLIYAHPRLKALKQVVLAAVSSFGYALSDASLALRADKEVVLQAVRAHGRALEYACTALRHDRDVCRAALARSPDAFFWVGDSLWEDRSFVLWAVRTAKMEYIPPSMVHDYEVAVASAVFAPLGLKCLPPSVLTRSFALDAVRRGANPSVVLPLVDTHPGLALLVMTGARRRAAVRRMRGAQVDELTLEVLDWLLHQPGTDAATAATLRRCLREAAVRLQRADRLAFEADALVGPGT